LYTGGIFVPLNELAVTERVTGEREVRRALEKGALRKLFVALDSDAAIFEKLVEKAEAMGVEVERVDSKLRLGRACAIDRSAAAAGLLRRNGSV
jgi:large subunit ribosomal protein L7A